MTTHFTAEEKKTLIAGVSLIRKELEAERRSFSMSRDELREHGEHEEADELHAHVKEVKQKLLVTYRLHTKLRELGA